MESDTFQQKQPKNREDEVNANQSVPNNVDGVMERQNCHDEDNATTSVSERIESQQLRQTILLDRLHSLLSWMERPFQVVSPVSKKKLKEATGWAMDAAGRGPLNQVGAFVGIALVSLAAQEAGCFDQNDETSSVPEEDDFTAAQSARFCTKQIRGLRPGSILTTISWIVGLVSAFIMPVIGAVVDRTRYRKHVGALSALVLVLVTGLQLMISLQTWPFVMGLEALGGLALLVHATTVNTYLPDLSRMEQDIVHYTTAFNVRQFTTQTMFAVLVVVINLISRRISEREDSENNDESSSSSGPLMSQVNDSINTSRAASAIAFTMSFILLGYSWTFLFFNRSALHDVHPGESIWTSGFVSLVKTSRQIFASTPLSSSRALSWFMIALLFSPEAGAGVILSITTTFLTIFLKMSAFHQGIVSLILLIFTVPGSWISRFFCQWRNPLISYRCAIFCTICIFSFAAAFLTGPARQFWVFGITAVIGLCLGWIYPTQRVLFVTLIPKGQEFEYMGLFTFFGQVLGWLPSLLFTIMNERGVNMRIGLALIPLFYVLSLFFVFMMDDYKAATVVAEPVKTVDQQEQQYQDKPSDVETPDVNLAAEIERQQYTRGRKHDCE